MFHYCKLERCAGRGYARLSIFALQDQRCQHYARGKFMYSFTAGSRTSKRGWSTVVHIFWLIFMYNVCWSGNMDPRCQTNKTTQLKCIAWPCAACAAVGQRLYSKLPTVAPSENIFVTELTTQLVALLTPIQTTPQAEVVKYLASLLFPTRFI